MLRLTAVPATLGRQAVLSWVTHMIIGQGGEPKSSEITPESSYLGRRQFLAAVGGAGAIAAAALISGRIPRANAAKNTRGDAPHRDQGDKPNSYAEITSYNNYYEFGTDKEDPKSNSGGFHPRPWSVRVEGLCRKPADYHLEDLIKAARIEDRIYRLRCVEAWSMVIPWQGIAMSTFLSRFQPLPSAKYVSFTTVLRPQEMPGQRRGILPWPYVEALRIDEAMHPLTLMATGLYGKELPNQNGAPLRAVIPWKYGFKGAKSIVRIAFTGDQPATTWNIAAPNEYGFYANVNPDVDHPRWTQARERRIGEFLRRRTLMFNGYADQVASLYAGMDLRKNF